MRALAFAGIHVCSPELLDHITERGVFPIIEVGNRLLFGSKIIGLIVIANLIGASIFLFAQKGSSFGSK